MGLRHRHRDMAIDRDRIISSAGGRWEGASAPLALLVGMFAVRRLRRQDAAAAAAAA